MLLSDSKSNDIFGEILDTFDMFNFTIYENDPLEQDVAVDPEMLGKVFENLLHIDERKEKGAFYTPREIVHYICKQVLLKYLVTKTGIVEERIAKLIARKDSMDNLKKLDDFTLSDADKKELRTEALAIDNALKEVKIIDPAV
jgi:adenine-specific DNA-methyltransferase